MNRFILALILSLGVGFYPTLVEAKPVEQQQVKKQDKKYKKKKKKPAIVQQQHNPFLRCEGCAPAAAAATTVTVATSSASHEQSAAEFFREDKERLQRQLLASPLKLSNDQKRQRVATSCSWFTCGGDNKVVMEAKQWEGKTAKKDRKELRNLFADSNVPPIDPVKTPWCAAFANAILSRSGYETTNSLMARSFLAWGVKTKDPKEGDIVVLKRGRSSMLGHVGFFQGYEVIDGITYVKVLGGNTDHAVQVGYYPVERVLGYRTAVA